MYVYKGVLYLCIIHVFNRELEIRLEKQKATRNYIDEFLQKREEVCIVSVSVLLLFQNCILKTTV